MSDLPPYPHAPSYPHLKADARIQSAKARFDHQDLKQALEAITRELREHTRILQSIERKLR